MKFNVFAYYDPAIKEYTQPIVSYLSIEDMVSQVSRLVVAGRLPNVEKCFLYLIGRYDSETGELEKDLHVLVDIAKDVVGPLRANEVIKDGD